MLSAAPITFYGVTSKYNKYISSVYDVNEACDSD